MAPSALPRFLRRQCYGNKILPYSCHSGITSFGVTALILLVSACKPFGISIEEEVVNWAIANYTNSH